MTGDGRKGDAPAGAARPDDSVGEYLARQRRLRGISIDELCERTRIPRRNLERLEAGAFDQQRDGFSRGFVRTVAAALGLDADEAVMRLMREPAAGEERDPRSDLRVHAQRFAVVAMLLLAGLALWAVVAGLRAAVSGPAEAPGVVYRPDVVRQLAEQAAAAPPPASAPAAIAGQAEAAMPPAVTDRRGMDEAAHATAPTAAGAADPPAPPAP